ncbi:MAG: InlB B-repeat-containing protein [Clostridia bacterium]|nr:InlB B-repeat-containing protein [Clostridia bacterium]
MKKHLIAVIIAVVTCLLTALSGCSLLRAFEKDVNVVFEVDGKYVDGVTVNIFNNAIAPTFDEDAEGAVPEGYKFMGWSASHDWKYGDDRDLLISSGGIVRYAAVKDWTNGGTAVAVPIVIDKTTIPKGDLVIAWYSNSGTSGISDGDISAFETQLREYLTQEGYDVSGLEIVIRGYGGNVGTSCGNIRKDDDVDIMLGWAGTSNLTGTGSMEKGKDIFENASNIAIGSKDRYAALCVDRDLGERELAVKVYDWIREKYVAEGKESVLENLKPVPVVTYKVTFNSNGGSAVDEKEVESGKTVQKPANPSKEGYGFGGWYTDVDCTEGNEYDFSTPVTDDLTLYAKWTEGEPEPEPAYDFGEFTQTKLVFGWWTSDSSGLSEDLVKNVIAGLKTALTASGVDVSALTIEMRAYDGKIATAGPAVAENPADILLGFGGNLTSNGVTLKAENRLTGVKMGDKTGRYIDLYDDTNDFAKAVFTWFKSEEAARALFAPAA